MCVFGERCEQSLQGCVCMCVSVCESHMGRRLRVGLATERTSWFMAPHRKSHGRAVMALPIQRPLESLWSLNHGEPAHCAQFVFTRWLILWLFVFAAMLQADDEDDMMEMQMKSPFGSSFRTFNATDYKPIGKASCPHLTFHWSFLQVFHNNCKIAVIFIMLFRDWHMFFVLFSATIDVKRNIFDLCTDTKDCYLAVIEVSFCHNVTLECNYFLLKVVIIYVSLNLLNNWTSFSSVLSRRTKTLLTLTQCAGCMKLAGRDLQRRRRRTRKIRFQLCSFHFDIAAHLWFI